MQIHTRLIARAETAYGSEIDGIHATHGQCSASVGMPLIKNAVDQLNASRAEADAILRAAFDAAVLESIQANKTNLDAMLGL